MGACGSVKNLGVGSGAGADVPFPAPLSGWSLPSDPVSPLKPPAPAWGTTVAGAVASGLAAGCAVAAGGAAAGPPSSCFIFSMSVFRSGMLVGNPIKAHATKAMPPIIRTFVMVFDNIFYICKSRYRYPHI